jgi:hypothetical protein
VTKVYVKRATTVTSDTANANRNNAKWLRAQLVDLESRYRLWPHLWSAARVQQTLLDIHAGLEWRK